MNRMPPRTLAATAVLLAVLAALLAPSSAAGATHVFYESYLLVNRGSEPYNLSGDYLVVDYPPNLPGQEVLNVTVMINGAVLGSEGYRVERSRDGAPSLRILAAPQALMPGEELNITVLYSMKLDPSRRPEWQPEVSELDLGETRLWNYSNPLIQAFLEGFDGLEGEDYLYALLGWIDDNLVYGSRIPARHPWEVLEEGVGDCDDRSNLLITLLRARGVPAYLEMGMIVLQGYEAEGTAENGTLIYRLANVGPHGWVKAWVGGRWVPVDMTYYTRATGTPLDHIAYSAYNTTWLPIIVTGWVKSTDYVSEGSSILAEAREKNLHIYMYIGVRKTG